jgi:hypothetical protein
MAAGLVVMDHVGIEGFEALTKRGFVDVTGIGEAVELVADGARGYAYVNVGGVCVLRISGATAVSVEAIGPLLSGGLVRAGGEGEEGEAA